MTLIKSISGIRGTIGGKHGDNFTPQDIVLFTSAYADWLINDTGKIPGKTKIQVVVGRDARISGPVVSDLICATLSSMGLDVINIGLASTPTTEMAVVMEKADGGIIITASHNPKEYNALKLLNCHGEFLNAAEGARILELAEAADFTYQDVMHLGKTKSIGNYEDKHIRAILDLPLVDAENICRQNYKVAIDCVNSVGGIGIPKLLKALGVSEVIELYCEPTGDFPHNPEPLPENLTAISEVIRKQGADVGFVVDPDVDRLAIVCEDGSMFGEEYTLVAIADYILQHNTGNTVSNMSSTRALRDVTEKYDGAAYFASAVGEVNVVEKMKDVNAVIGGEGNGGVIYPDLHHGRDALVGIALFLSFMAKRNCKVSEIRAGYPEYVISKNKIQLTPDTDVNAILHTMKVKYKNQPVSTIDGVKIEFDDEWVHLRKSNTEPIIRIYSESKSKARADELAYRIMMEIEEVK
ncbi:MAG: phosphoglucosamine mutase [Candidatus Delongbacteria bacterium]|jgi:phosphomannomutase|nr:phosphoglucosamine mutase [Candidatus Delongbacteria bacterium]